MNNLPMNKIILADCMDIMRDIPDKYFELAIVDPPYGIDINMNMGLKKGQIKKYIQKKWDKTPPDRNYFDALMRISKNQIIWGGNYFELPANYHFIFWDKLIPYGMSFSDGEYAWTSFHGACVKFTQRNNGNETKIHPTQKPIALYRWLLQNYAKPGDKIIDTHSGSGSCAIACFLERFEFLAIEKDADYHAASVKRLDGIRAQGRLF